MRARQAEDDERIGDRAYFSNMRFVYEIFVTLIFKIANTGVSGRLSMEERRAVSL